jgi:hypothetical protein
VINFYAERISATLTFDELPVHHGDPVGAIHHRSGRDTNLGVIRGEGE